MASGYDLSHDDSSRLSATGTSGACQWSKSTVAQVSEDAHMTTTVATLPDDARRGGRVQVPRRQLGCVCVPGE